MKRPSTFKAVLLSALTAFCIMSCNNSKKEAEESREAEVGNAYDPEHQGIDHENRDNQFQSSRDDNEEGTGQETGAPSDTIDGDGDTKVYQEPNHK